MGAGHRDVGTKEDTQILEGKREMEMKYSSSVLGEVVPGMLMALMEACTIGLTIMASTIFSKGMSPFVFLVYTNSLASLFLLPYNSIFYRHRREVLRWPFLARIFVLGLTGVTMAQNLSFAGLSYSSPILVCGMANLIPSISFLVSIFLGNTYFEWRSKGSQVRLVGTMISVVGALSITYYKGPPIKYASPHQLQLALAPPRLFIFSSTNEHWTLGALYLAAGSLSVSIWNTIQAKTIKLYPEVEVMSMASSYTLMGTLQSALLSILVERDLSAWKLKLDMQLLVIVATAIFGSLIRSHVHKWCIQHKGPSYVPMFKPLGIPIASMCGCFFFANTFHYGSIMGATICGVGYYTVMWGQIKLEEESSRKEESESESSEEKVPLLEDQV